MNLNVTARGFHFSLICETHFRRSVITLPVCKVESMNGNCICGQTLISCLFPTVQIVVYNMQFSSRYCILNKKHLSTAIC